MPKRKQRDEKPKEGECQNQNDGNNAEHKPDPIVRVIAHSSDVLAAAVGPHIRMFNCKAILCFFSLACTCFHLQNTSPLLPSRSRDQQPAEMDAAQAHTGAVRSLALSPDGAMLLSGSDDKSCKLWDTASRKCLATWSVHCLNKQSRGTAPGIALSLIQCRACLKSLFDHVELAYPETVAKQTARRMHKKLSAVAFSRDGKHALFADKFGDVGVAACGNPAQQQPPSEEPELLLGHLCSIITSITVSPDNRCVRACVCVCACIGLGVDAQQACPSSYDSASFGLHGLLKLAAEACARG
eukprot:890704-Pelagomonas_calceolata.AAC.3